MTDESSSIFKRLKLKVLKVKFVCLGQAAEQRVSRGDA